MIPLSKYNNQQNIALINSEEQAQTSFYQSLASIGTTLILLEDYLISRKLNETLQQKRKVSQMQF
ncbi:MAG: hypothetical protein PVF17_00025 [Ignavibacteria bacterium]|jgi:hypothetical protein